MNLEIHCSDDMAAAAAAAAYIIYLIACSVKLKAAYRATHAVGEWEMKRMSEKSSRRRKRCISAYFWHVSHSFILRLLFFKCASKFVSHLFFRLHQPKQTSYFGWIFRPCVSMAKCGKYTQKKATNFIETIEREKNADPVFCIKRNKF